MMDSKTHFRQDTRHIVIVEEAPDMETAEKQADAFLLAESSADESGTCYLRAKASGIKREAGYYFKVVTVSDPAGQLHA